MKIITGILLLLTLASCQKYLDVKAPYNQLPAGSVFRNEATATAALLAIYGQMESDGLFYKIITSTGLSSDELINYSTLAFDIDLASNNLTANNPVPYSLWQSFYKYIYLANALLDGVQSSPLGNMTKNQLSGEALFIRSLCYYYLVQYFGDVPLVTGPDYRVNISLPRSPASAIIQSIQTDLQSCVTLLSPQYLTAANSAGSERVRANQAAAHALLSKVSLLAADWTRALLASSAVIGQSQLYSLQPDLATVFAANSGEAILQLQAQVPTYNSYPGAFLILLTTPASVSLDTLFVKSFSAPDKRRSQWISSVHDGSNEFWFPYKYKVGQNAATVSEYTMVLRLAEQFLIRSEAYARLDQLTESEQDLNTIRNRAGLLSLLGLSKQALLDSITLERRRELFTEAGDRWFTLKRTGTADAVLAPFKGNSWSSTDKLYPIPQQERLLNTQLSQNKGY